MMRSYALSFKPAAAPCRELVTKFGGQPVWVQQAQWPLSASSGEQMKFICQIAVYPELFGQGMARMAYVFMTDLEKQVVPAWDPNGGENAVIMQPGRPANIQTKSVENGPTLYEYVEIPGDPMLHARPCEYIAELTKRNDPDFVDEVNRSAMDEISYENYSKAVEGNKVGGTPAFLQEDAFPAPGHLLLQLDSAKVPFYINFGDCGVGFAFISADTSAGKFLFQSY
jgi:hypothetical protein